VNCDRIVDEVHQDLAKPIGIAFDRADSHSMRCGKPAQGLVLRPLSEHLDDFFDGDGRVELDFRQLDLARLDLGGIETPRQ
jgi:hypothetical protein